jgi:hypothetical protein
VAAVQQRAQHAEIGHGDVRSNGSEDFRMVVAGEHGDGGNAAVTGGFHVVGHVPDEGGFVRIEGVGFEDAVDDLALVEHAGVGGFEEIAQAELVHLPLEGGGVHGSQDKSADAAAGAPFELFPGMGEDGDGRDRLIEGRAEVGLEFL